MKRHKSLIPLSQDHHSGLLLAQLSKKTAPNYQKLPNDDEGKKEYALNAWENELVPHFKHEEEILFPFVKGRDDELDEVIQDIYKEHEVIRSQFAKLKEVKDDLKELLNDIGFTLEAHIRKEEKQLFQRIQEVFSDGELKELVGKIDPVK